MCRFLSQRINHKLGRFYGNTFIIKSDEYQQGVTYKLTIGLFNNMHQGYSKSNNVIIQINRCI